MRGHDPRAAFLGAPALSEPRVPLPSFRQWLVAIRPERLLHPGGRPTEDPALPLRHLPSTVRRSDLLDDLLAAPARAAPSGVPSPPGLLGISPDRPGASGVRGHDCPDECPARPALPALSSGEPPARDPARAVGPRQLRELRVEPVLPHELSRRGGPGLALLLRLHRERVPPARHDDPRAAS